VPSWLWVIIVTGVLVLLVVVVWAAMKGREKQRERKEREAERLRLEAERTLAGAEQAEESAQRAEQRSHAERSEAERLRREAETRQARAEELSEISEDESLRKYPWRWRGSFDRRQLDNLSCQAFIRCSSICAQALPGRIQGRAHRGLRARAFRTAIGSTSSGDEFPRRRFPDGYRVKLIEQRGA